MRAAGPSRALRSLLASSSSIGRLRPRRKGSDTQFPGVYNDALFLWAMVDTEDGKRYELIRELSASAAFDFNLHECSTDLWAHPRNVRFPGEHDLYWGLIMWFERDGRQLVYPAHAEMRARHRMRISLGPDEYLWKEDEDCIDVVLTPLPMNVTAIYVPGLPDDVGYTSSGCMVSGSIEGSKITGGYGGLDSKVFWETKADLSQPHRSSLSFGGRTFDFEATHNAAAAGVSLGIAWVHGTMQEQGGPTPIKSWSTMEVIKSRATPRT